MRKVGFTAHDRALKVAEAALLPKADKTAPPPGAEEKKPKGKANSRGSGKKKDPPAAEAKAEVIESAGDGGDVPEAQPEPGDAVGDGA